MPRMRLRRTARLSCTGGSSTQVAYTLSLLFADSGNDTGVLGQATSIGSYILIGGAFSPQTVIDAAVGENTTGTAVPLLGG
jgi:hypothetical protein